jgi:hypothetical protein
VIRRMRTSRPSAVRAMRWIDPCDQRQRKYSAKDCAHRPYVDVRYLGRHNVCHMSHREL